MRIYLVQHGESKSEEEDPQRHLTDKGIAEVRHVVNFLRPLELVVDTVWHSGKTRAQQTGELLAEVLRARLVQRVGLGPKDQVVATKEALKQTGGNLMQFARAGSTGPDGAPTTPVYKGPSTSGLNQFGFLLATGTFTGGAAAPSFLLTNNGANVFTANGATSTQAATA